MLSYWTGYSEDLLRTTESKILSSCNTPCESFYVPVIIDGVEEKIWTVSLNTKSKNTPLVLLHGFGAGLGFWCLNLDSFSKDRPVYAMDIIGFGLSSRTTFSNNAAKNETKIVESIEKWRKYLKLDNFFLLGHSMGGYLSTCYALAHPKNVKLLLLCDGWGFSDKYEFPPYWLKAFCFVLDVLRFNPLMYLRWLGPLGSSYIKISRQDLLKHYRKILKDNSLLPTYIYQCNAHPNPTGETGFYSFVDGICWAKNPLIKRIENLKREIPMKIMYGSETWVDKEIGPRIKKMRPGSLVDIEIIDNSGHHIYADQAEKFNEIVNKACESIETKNMI